MNDSQRQEAIALKLEYSDMQKENVRTIQELYCQYFEEGSNDIIKELLIMMDKCCLDWIRKSLWAAGYYADDSVSEILQESRIGVWTAMEKDRQAGKIRDNFMYYAYGIYRHKTQNLIRKYSSERKKIFYPDYGKDADESETGREPIQERSNPQPGSDMVLIDQEKRELYSTIFIIYCKKFMTNPTYPPRGLALCYARVLPHLLGEISDSKGASAKWAFERMKGQTVGMLKDDSEDILQDHIDRDLHWCDEFVQQLEQQADIPEETCLLRDIVYTSFFRKEKIEDWAEAMHKTTVKMVSNEIMADADLKNKIVEYAESRDRFIGRLIKRKGAGR